MLSDIKIRHKTIDIEGIEIHYRESGVKDRAAIVLLHGYPGSSHMFRNVISPLAEFSYVVAPDFPAFGFSDAPSMEEYAYTFENISGTIATFLDRLEIDDYFLYVHDWGSAVAYNLALRYPDHILGLIVQNGNAHNEGLGTDWDPVKLYWENPTKENRKNLGEWMNYEGVKNEYLGGLPDSLAALHPPESWHLDWERMSRPKIKDVFFRLFIDFKNHVHQFPEIAEYHSRYQPPCLVLWGKLDPFFDLGEVFAYNRALQNVESHIYHAGHFLLETHHQECAELIKHFVKKTMAERKE